MTQDLLQQRIINPILTDRALSYSSPVQKWNDIAPRVPVQYRGGQIVKFGKERFKQYASKRAPGADTTTFDINYTTEVFYLDQSRLKTKVPLESQEEAKIPGIDLRMESVDAVREYQEREVEFDAATLLTDPAQYPSGHAPTIASGDKWDAYTTSKPINQILNAANTIRGAIGITPNTLFLCPAAWTVLRDHPDFIDRIKYTEIGFLIEDTASKILRFNVVVGEDITVDNSGNVSDIWAINGNNAILAYVAQPMTGNGLNRRQPSFAYTYVHEGYPLVEEGEYVKNTSSWQDYVTYERKTYLTMPDAGYLFNAVTT